MPRVKRREICADDEVQAFHLINRCVRRTYSCGKDRRSKKDCSHRKEWIRARLEELAGTPGIDVLSFAVLSNRLHIIVRKASSSPSVSVSSGRGGKDCPAVQRNPIAGRRPWPDRQRSQG